MLEPLVAVGLAANVLQFAQAVVGIVVDAVAIKRTGAPCDVPDLKGRSERLVQLAGHIKSQIQAGETIRTPEDQYLFDTACNCESSGQEFIQYLDSFIANRRSSNPFKNAQASIKFHWSHQKMDHFISKLKDFQGTLMNASVLAFRSSEDAYNRKILETLEEVKCNQKQSIQQNEALSKVQKLVDFWEANGAKFSNVQEEIRDCFTRIYLIKNQSNQDVEDTILKWLDYRQMSWRYEAVPDAYQSTFQWIFKPPCSEDSWDDFGAYLSGTDTAGIYFINGKAGSGKSTLMKYLLSVPSTGTELRKWTGARELFVADFFFWNLGTRIQRSLVGMLRSILYKVLKRYPELIPTVFHRLYQTWAIFDTSASIEPTYHELKTAFELLMEKSSAFLRLCIFIDGIDEFEDDEGDHRDILEFFRSLTSPNLKLIVSSRPINACLNAFQDLPSLKLQNLTRTDMEIVIHEKFTQHPYMVSLSKQFPNESQELVKDMKSKAEGVFLWVILVIRELLKGLENGDTLQDLNRKLQSLPSGLQELYERMFAKMSPEHRAQASEIFQIMRFWNNTTNFAPLTTIKLHFACQDPTSAFHYPVLPLDTDKLKYIGSQTASRVRSRCCGLIDIHESRGTNHTSIGPLTSTVSYHHRTIAEFLLDPHIWATICKETKDSNFDPSVHLAASYLCMLKILAPNDQPYAVLYISRIFLYYSLAARPATQGLVEHVNAVDETMSTLQHHQIIAQGGDVSEHRLHWSEYIYPRKNTGLASPILPELNKAGSVLTFASRMGLFQLLMAEGRLSEQSHIHRRAMILSALESWEDVINSSLATQHLGHQDRAETMRILLEKCSGNESDIIDDAEWKAVINIGRGYLERSMTQEYTDLLKMFIVASRHQPQAVLDVARIMANSTNMKSRLLGINVMKTIQERNATSPKNVVTHNAHFPRHVSRGGRHHTYGRPPPERGRRRGFTHNHYVHNRGARRVTTGQAQSDHSKGTQSGRVWKESRYRY